MTRNNYLLLIAILLFSKTVSAQKKIILESVRYATNINYLQDPANQKLFLRNLENSLTKHQQVSLADSVRLNLADMRTRGVRDLQQVSFENTDTSMLHLFIDVAEYPADMFFSSVSDTYDSVLQKEAKTVFRVVVQVARHDKAVVYYSKMDVALRASQGPGMGYLSPDLFLMPRSFVEMLRTAFDLMFDPQNEAESLSVKVAPLYCTDNFIQQRVAGHSRIIPADNRGIISFVYQGKQQMLRRDSALYEQLILKGRRAVTYPQEIMTAIRGTRNTSVSDFVFLRQEARDVLYNKNYLVKLLVQIDPEIPVVIPEHVFTNFLPGDIHLLLNDNDTIARFSIDKNVPAPDIKAFTGRVYNGIDSATAFTIAEKRPPWQMVSMYVLKGKIGNRNFSIRCTGVNGVVKEIYLDDQLVSIAQGRQKPEVFVVFDASLSPEILNQLLIIGFNRFFG